MSVSPGLYVAADVDGMSRRPRLTVEISNLCALWGLVHDAGSVKIGEAGNAGAGVGCVGTEGFEQVLHRKLPFAEDDEVRACLKIFKGVGAWLGTADDGLPASLASDFEGLDHIAACHQIGIDADD